MIKEIGAMEWQLLIIFLLIIAIFAGDKANN